MTIQTIEKRENPLMGRDEYWLSLDHLGKPTPKREEVAELVAKHLSSSREVILIRKIFSEDGMAKSRIKVHVYSDKAKVPQPRQKKAKKGAQAEATQPKKEA